MSTKVVYYGDILGLYINDVFSKTTKSLLSEGMGYKRASSFRSMLFRNQQYPIEKVMLETIDDVYGLNYFISILDEFKRDKIKNISKKLECYEVRLNVEATKSHYYTELYSTISNELIEE